MQKKFFISFIFIILVSMVCFAQTSRFRYVRVIENVFIILEYTEDIPQEELPEKMFSLNKKQGRFVAEYVLNSLKELYDSVDKDITLMYFDYTKDSDDPDCSYIDSWSDFLDYVRGTKEIE